MSKLTDKLVALIAVSVRAPAYSQAIDVLNDVMELERTLAEYETRARLASCLTIAQNQRIQQLETALQTLVGTGDK